jgi:hypothetical protein
MCLFVAHMDKVLSLCEPTLVCDKHKRRIDEVSCAVGAVQVGDEFRG